MNGNLKLNVVTYPKLFFKDSQGDMEIKMTSKIYKDALFYIL